VEKEALTARMAKLEEKEFILADVQDMLKNREKALDRLKKEKEALESTYRSDMEALEEQVERLNREKRQMEGELQLLQSTNHDDTKARQIKEQEELIQALQAEKAAVVAQWNSDVQQLESMASDAQRQLDERNALVIELEKEKEVADAHWRGEFERLKASYDSEVHKGVHEQVVALEGERAKLLEELSSIKAHGEDLEMEHGERERKLSEELAVVRAKLSDFEEIVAKYKEELHGLSGSQQEVMRLREEREKDQQWIKELESLSNSHGGEAETLRAQLQGLEKDKEEIESLQAQLQEKDASIVAIQAELREARDHAQELTERVQALQQGRAETVEQLQNDIALLREQLREVQQAHKIETGAHSSLQREASHVKNTLSETQAWLNESREEAIKAAAELAQVREEILASNEEVKRKEIEIDGLRQDLEALEVKLTHANEEIGKLTTSADAEIRALQQEIEIHRTAAGEGQGLQAELARIKEENITLETAAEAKANEIVYLQEQVIALKKMNSTTEAELGKAKEELALAGSTRDELNAKIMVIEGLHSEIESLKKSASENQAAMGERVKFLELSLEERTQAEKVVAQQLAKLREEAEKTSALLKVADEAKEAAEVALLEQRNELTRLMKSTEEEIAALQETLTSRQQELEKSKSRVRDLEEERRQSIATSDYKIAELVNQHEAEVKNMAAQIQTLKRQQGEERAAHETELFRLKQEMAAVNQRVKGVDEVHEELERLRLKKKKDLDEVRRLNQHVSALQLAHLEALAVVRGEKDVVVKECESLRMTIQELQKSQEISQETEFLVKNSNGGGDSVETSTVNASEMTKRLEQEVAQAQQELAQTRDAMVALEARLMVEQGEVNKWKDEAEKTALEMGRKLHSTEAFRNALKKDVAHLKAELSVTKQQQQVLLQQQQQQQQQQQAAGGEGLSSAASIYQRTGRQMPSYRNFPSDDDNDVESQAFLDFSRNRKGFAFHRIPGLETCLIHSR